MENELLRKLIYEEKPLNAWDYSNEESLYCAIFEKLLEVEGFRPSDPDALKRVPRVFNDATFLCTLIYDYDVCPFMRVGDYLEMVTPSENARSKPCIETWQYAIVVLEVTYLMLLAANQLDNDSKIKRTTHALDDYLRVQSAYSSDIHIHFAKATCPIYSISAVTFMRRTLTKKLVESIDWQDATNGYDTECIEGFIVNFGSSKQEKLWLIDAIEQQVKRTESNDPDLNPLPF